MSLLCIDFGEKHVGFAWSSENMLAEPLQTVACNSAVSFATTFCDINEVDTIVVGLPEGRIRNKVKLFGKSIESATKNPVIYWDETLSSQKAMQKLIEENVPRKKRKEREHSVSAALILQSYIDELYASKT